MPKVPHHRSKRTQRGDSRQTAARRWDKPSGSGETSTHSEPGLDRLAPVQFALGTCISTCEVFGHRRIRWIERIRSLPPVGAGMNPAARGNPAMLDAKPQADKN
jgi:hypothetical protein